MMLMRPGYRRCAILAIALLCALFAAACGHRELPRYEPIMGEEDWGPPGFDARFVSAQIASVGIHRIEIAFKDSMSISSVEVRVKDSEGAPVKVEREWRSSGGYIMNDLLVLRGPFAFCSRYFVTVLAGATSSNGIVLDRDLAMSLITGRNPMNFDLDTGCTAEIPLSPVYADGADGAVITGEMLALGGPEETWRQSDLDSTGTLYFDHSGYFDGGGPMVLLPDAAGPGRPAAAKLFHHDERDEKGAFVARHYELMVWGEHRPRDDEAGASFLHTIRSNSRVLLGPHDAGDLDGDGRREIILSEETRLSSGAAMQRIYILKAPFTEGPAMLLEDAAFAIAEAGFPTEWLSPPVSVGDLDGDGMDDLASIRCGLTPTGGRRNCEVVIYRGSADIREVFYENRAILLAGHPSRVMLEIGKGDVNGDGRPDLLVSDIQVLQGSRGPIYYRPRIGVFFGGGSLEGRSMVSPDAALTYNNIYRTEFTFRVLGDVSGNGIDDVGAHMIERDDRGRLLHSNIFVFTGRPRWFHEHRVNSNLVITYYLKINTIGFDVLSWGPAGDVNNSGFYDLMVYAESGPKRSMHLFLGKSRSPSEGWRFGLDEADVVWSFDGDR